MRQTSFDSKGKKLFLSSLFAVLFCLVAPWGCRQVVSQDVWAEAIEKAFAEGKPDKAIEAANRFVESSPASSNVHLVRGMVYFRAGKIDESLKDFDKSIELEPASAPYNWQRGISLYYAGKYEEGQKQFEIHREVNGNDVENSVWHFLCVAKKQGIEEAKKKLIPVTFDSRKPMMEVMKLFAGESTPEKVVAAAEENQSRRGAKLSLFYGYLYVGLYYEATGETGKANEFLQKAVDQEVGGYMADVARVHLQLKKK